MWIDIGNTMKLSMRFMCFLAVLFSPCWVHAQTYEAFTEPERTVHASSADTGRVSQVVVKRGDRVQRGDLLMVLESRILEASLQTARRKANSNARIKALEVEYDLRRQRHEQLRSLAEDGAGNPEEVRRAKADLDMAALNVEAAREEQALNALQVAEIEARIEQRKVRSPVDGVVTDVLKEVGEYVSSVEPQVATVVQLGRLRATFYLPSPCLSNIQHGMEVPMTTAQGDTINGMVEYVAPVTEADSGRARVDVLIDNPQRTLRSGVRCDITLKETP